MNSRSVSDNLVNFSTELATTLNQLDSKEPLLSFPFDHIYACHSESSDRRQGLHLDKEVEISTHCGLPHQDKHVTQRLVSLETQNKKLKDLLIYHLDLIQQQNELMSKREKVYQAIKQENDTLKCKVTRVGVDKQLSSYTRHIPPPLHVPVTATVTSSSYRSDVPSSTSQQSFYSTLNDLLLAKESGNQNPYLFNTGLSPEVEHTPPQDAELQSFLAAELQQTIATDLTDFTMIDNKRPKKEHKPAIDVNKEPKYTVTTSSGNPKIQRNRKRPTGIGSFSRMPKTKTPAKTTTGNVYDEDVFSVNKQSKMTYGKSKLSKYGYTALQERLQLIEPTPTGEDPYQIGEAEMREQSPIPKLMLQKTNHGRMRICSGADATGVSTTLSSIPTRRIYDTLNTTSASSSTRTKRSKTSDRYGATNMHVQSKTDETNVSLEDEPELDVEKTDNSDIDWRLFTTNTATKPKETSLCDFSYGETSANLVNIPLDITKMEFPDFFEPSPVNADSSSATELEVISEKNASDKTKKRGARTTSLAGPLEEETVTEIKPETKRGRKRALSTAATIKRSDSQQKAPAKPRARRAIRAKKTPVPGMTTKKLYHTCMGDPDLSWYLNLDPDIKKEDCEPTDNTTSNVEVPRWREKPYSSLYSLEGTENLDDKVFEKRHQKLEAEERRQLRWHMRRIREQRHVERLRQRQRDPWGPNSAQTHARGEYTVWPQPIRDLQYIEITDTLPVIAFGEEIPALPEKNFVISWVRSSKAQKRSKRSKTLH